ncbi:hypothetical protein EV685_4046, partial [Sphaerotilus mobilis]
MQRGALVTDEADRLIRLIGSRLIQIDQSRPLSSRPISDGLRVMVK